MMVGWCGLSASIFKQPRYPPHLGIQIVFQMFPQHVGQPRLVGNQEIDTELIVGNVKGVKVTVDHVDRLIGHLGQSIGHVQVVQNAVDVVSLDQDKIAVVFGAIRSRVAERLDDGHDEFPRGVVDGGSQDLFHIGNGFECLHGGSPVVVEGVITGSAFWAERAALHGVDRERHLKGRWMGLDAYSNKIPRGAQFTVPGGLHGELMMGTKKPADPGGRAGAMGGAGGGSVRGGQASLMGLQTLAAMSMP